MLLFRADGNEKIGTGHVMRCLAIAEAAAEYGVGSVFVTADYEMERVIKQRNHDCYVLDTDYRENDENRLEAIAEDIKPDAIFVDSYYVSQDYFFNLFSWCHSNNCKLIYIDDLKAFPYCCDFLVNYQIHANYYEYDALYSACSKPSLLLGLKYVPLRREFGTLVSNVVKKEVLDVLVSTGGADPENLSIELMKRAMFEDYRFHFVIGAMNSDRKVLKELSRRASNIHIYENVSKMSVLMESCDIAISASGSTLYELCSLRVPTISYILADNQKEIAEAFDAKGIIRNCGDIRIIGKEKLAEVLLENVNLLSRNYKERCEIVDRMSSVVDGKGAGRIVRALLSNIE